MGPQAVIWTVIGIYIIFMVAIALFNHKSSKNLAEFTVGGRNAGAWLSALSYGTAYFSAVMFIGYAGSTGWQYGIWGVLPGIGNAIFGSLLAWLVLAKRTRDVTRRLHIKSMPQFFDARFKSRAMRLFSCIVIFVFLMPYSASVYKGLTSVCSVLLNVDPTICMIIIAAASAVLVIIGGYLATLKADFVQGIIMMFGVVALIVAVIISPKVGGLTEGLKNITQATKELNLTTMDHISLWATVLMTSFGTWGLPQMIHKYYGIRDNREVKRGTVISTVFALLVAGGGYFIGSFSHLFFTQQQVTDMGGQDYIVPNMLLQSDLSNILLGVVLVLLISASVSTLSSITLTACSSLTMDIFPEKIKKNKENKIKATKYTKLFCLIFVLLSYIIANTNTPILDMMSYSWGIISGSFLAPYLVSLYWKRINRAGGWAGIIGGFAIAMVPALSKIIMLCAGSPANPTGIMGVFNKLAGFGPLFACIAMIVSLILVFVVSIIAEKSGSKNAEPNEFFYTGSVETVK